MGAWAFLEPPCQLWKLCGFWLVTSDFEIIVKSLCEAQTLENATPTEEKPCIKRVKVADMTDHFYSIKPQSKRTPYLSA